MSAPRIRRLLVFGGIGAALLVIVLFVSVPFRSPNPDSTCPRGYNKDSLKKASILSNIHRTNITELVDRYKGPFYFCFGSPDTPSVTQTGIFLLDDTYNSTENSAHVAHLLVHRLEGAPFDENKIGKQGCSVLVRSAVQAEARAFAAEVSVRESLQITEPSRKYGFEPQIYRTPPERRAEQITVFLYDHPEGDSTIVGYVSLYTKQCEELTRKHEERNQN